MDGMGARIKEAREELGMSTKALAEILHVAERTIRTWEQGTREPNSLELLRRLAIALNVDSNYLLGL